MEVSDTTLHQVRENWTQLTTLDILVKKNVSLNVFKCDYLQLYSNPSRYIVDPTKPQWLAQLAAFVFVYPFYPLTNRQFEEKLRRMVITNVN